jgi:hypothetical protein
VLDSVRYSDLEDPSTPPTSVQRGKAARLIGRQGKQRAPVAPAKKFLPTHQQTSIKGVAVPLGWFNRKDPLHPRFVHYTQTSLVKQDQGRYRTVGLDVSFLARLAASAPDTPHLKPHPSGGLNRDRNTAISTAVPAFSSRRRKSSILDSRFPVPGNPLDDIAPRRGARCRPCHSCLQSVIATLSCSSPRSSSDEAPHKARRSRPKGRFPSHHRQARARIQRGTAHADRLLTSFPRDPPPSTSGPAPASHRASQTFEQPGHTGNRAGRGMLHTLPLPS